MSSTNWIELIVATAALLVMTLSAWVEISLTTVTRIDIRRLLDERLSREDAQLIERTQRLRSSMLLLELLSAGVLSTMIVIVMRDTIADNGLLYGLITVLAVLIVFGRLVPRFFVSDDQASEPRAALRVGRTLAFAFAPVVRPVEAISALATRGKRRREDTVSVEVVPADISGFAQAAEEHQRAEPYAIEEDEQDMISGVLHLDEATARDIMVPRIDIVGVSKDVLVSEAVDVAIQAGHSRIPVYDKSIDDILGIVYAKDLLRYVNEEHEGVTVERLVRPAYIVPESKHVDDLLAELQQSKVHMAVVVDEYGGTAGVVTIEDILEEIVGEIQDEYDRETPPLEMVDDDVAIADGRISIADLFDEMDVEWPEEISGTLGGYLQRQLGRIPAEGEVVRIDGLRLTVLRAERRRVRQVRVERMREDGDAERAEAQPDESAIISRP